MARVNLTGEELAEMLVQSVSGGYVVEDVSQMAFEIYTEHGRHLTSKMNNLLLTLMVMEVGPEFALSESEFFELISEVRAL
tara:strand:- start:7 stop:249 length:243 start_codon:yes stop_codon:yes gene_type:complete